MHQNSIEIHIILMHKNDEYCVWNSLKTLASLVGSAFHDPCTCRSVRLMVLYDITTGWLTWVNQSLADGTDPRSGRNLFNKAKNASFRGECDFNYKTKQVDVSKLQKLQLLCVPIMVHAAS